MVHSMHFRESVMLFLVSLLRTTPGVLSTSIAIYLLISEVLWIDGMTLNDPMMVGLLLVQL